MNRTSEHYIPQLDTVRAFAVTFVLLGHWIPEETIIGKYIVAPFHLAQLGVEIFFVLSGFLIGSILIRNSYNLTLQMELSKWRVIKNFFIRRTLRIFPIYYILLFFLLLINHGQIKELLPWLLSYATNFYIFKIQNWIDDYSHLWSLAVEEQFYLVFPWLIIFIYPRHLFKVILIFIMIGFIFRACVYVFHVHPMAYNLAPALFDYFGIGALLAYFRINNVYLSKKTFWRILVGLVWLYFLLPTGHFNGKSIIFLVAPITPLFFAFIIDYCCDSSKGFFSAVLMCRPLLYLGRISYGIYLFHNFIPSLRMSISTEMDLTVNSLALRTSFDFVLTVIIASLSYFLIESPINKLKNSYTS